MCGGLEAPRVHSSGAREPLHNHCQLCHFKYPRVPALHVQERPVKYQTVPLRDSPTECAGVQPAQRIHFPNAGGCAYGEKIQNLPRDLSFSFCTKKELLTRENLFGIAVKHRATSKHVSQNPSWKKKLLLYWNFPLTSIACLSNLTTARRLHCVSSVGRVICLKR